jgi:DNA-directed RNA polymerase specialized sigma24 family protein
LLNAPERKNSSLTTVNRSARTRREKDLTPETFGHLLEWLDRDRDRAGQRYEQIRLRLIKIFLCRGCTVAEELADETINRVAEKIQQIAGGYVGDPASYFCGVAHKIYLEHARTPPLASLPADVAEKKEPLQEEGEVRYKCMEQCMERISIQNRELILAYYGVADDSQSKISARKELSQRLGIGANALWIRSHRIREGLKKCVTMCLERKQASQPGEIE